MIKNKPTNNAIVPKKECAILNSGLFKITDLIKDGSDEVAILIALVIKSFDCDGVRGFIWFVDIAVIIKNS